MALCQYCGKVEIAWMQQPDRTYVACHAVRDAGGAVVKREVRDGTRTVRRPVADPAKVHYPHANWHGGLRTASECEVWTPLLSKARKATGRVGWRRPVASPPYSPADLPAPVADRDHTTEDLLAALKASVGTHSPSVVVGVDLAADAVTPIAGMGAAVASAAAAKTWRLPEPEELLNAAQRAQWARAEAAIRCAIIPTRVMLWGRPGTGKTELPWRIAQEMGWSHHYQLMSDETPGTELLGHLAVQAGNTVWCDGSLGRALRASQVGPTVLVIDEIGHASADAMTACLLALTNPESLRLTLRSGEVLAPKPENWHVVATSNDEPGMLPSALADRLHINVRVDAPHPGLVRSLTTVEARRAACATSAEYSVRALLTYDRLRASGMSLEDAAGMVWEPATASGFVDAARLEGGRK